MTLRHVFVDASAWIALIYEKDGNHEKAKEIYQEELKRNSLFFISNWSSYEALSFLKDRAGIDKARNLQHIISDKNIISRIRVDPNIEREALNIFWSYEDKNWGIVDITSLLIIQQCRCNFAFAFDHHFEEAALQYPSYHFTLLT